MTCKNCAVVGGGWAPANCISTCPHCINFRSGGLRWGQLTASTPASTVWSPDILVAWYRKCQRYKSKGFLETSKHCYCLIVFYLWFKHCRVREEFFDCRPVNVGSAHAQYICKLCTLLGLRSWPNLSNQPNLPRPTFSLPATHTLLPA